MSSAGLQNSWVAASALNGGASGGGGVPPNLSVSTLAVSGASALHATVVAGNLFQSAGYTTLDGNLSITGSGNGLSLPDGGSIQTSGVARVGSLTSSGGVSASGVPITGLSSSGQSLSSSTTPINVQAVGNGSGVALTTSQLVVSSDSATKVVSISDVVYPDTHGAFTYTYPYKFSSQPVPVISPLVGCMLPSITNAGTLGVSGVCRQYSQGDGGVALKVSGRASSNLLPSSVYSVPALHPSAPFPLTIPSIGPGGTVKYSLPTAFVIPSNIDAAYISYLKVGWRNTTTITTANTTNPVQAVAFSLLLSNTTTGAVNEGVEIANWNIPLLPNQTFPIVDFAGASYNQYYDIPLAGLIPGSTLYFVFQSSLSNNGSSNPVSFSAELDVVSLSYFQLPV